MKNRIAFLIVTFIGIAICGCHLFKKDVTRKITYCRFFVTEYDDKSWPADTSESYKFYVYLNDKGCVIDWDDCGCPTLYLSGSDSIYKIDTIGRIVERSVMNHISESPYYFIKDSSVHDHKWGDGVSARICTPIESEKGNDTISNITVWTSDIKLPRGAATDIISRAGFKRFPSKTALIRLEISDHVEAEGKIPARAFHGICEIQSIEDQNVPDRISQAQEYLKKF